MELITKIQYKNFEPGEFTDERQPAFLYQTSIIESFQHIPFMRSSCLILTLLFLGALKGFSQDQVGGSNPQIVVTYEINAYDQYEFSCQNRASCKYILELHFDSLVNLRATVSLPFTTTVAPGTNKIFKLIRILPMQPTNLSYKYQYRPGCINPKVDTDYTYLLPIAPGKQTRVFESPDRETQWPPQSEPKDWYALGLDVKPGDTIYAARGGVVTDFREYAHIKDSGAAYSRKDNFIEIYQKDCSFATYSRLKDGGILVREDQYVEAGQPIGLAADSSDQYPAHVFFSVHYNSEQDRIKGATPGAKKSVWAYAPLKFWTKGKGKIKLHEHISYISEHPAELITNEMSKKEAKEWNKAHS